MINEVVINYVLLFVLLELYEISWQKAQTIMGMIARMNIYYSKSIFLFLVMQPTFYFSIGFAMISDYCPYAMIMLFIKTFDVATKIILIEQVFKKQELTQELTIILLAPINGFLPYLGLVIYPIFIAMCLQPF